MFVPFTSYGIKGQAAKRLSASAELLVIGTAGGSPAKSLNSITREVLEPSRLRSQ